MKGKKYLAGACGFLLLFCCFASACSPRDRKASMPVAASVASSAATAATISGTGGTTGGAGGSSEAGSTAVWEIGSVVDSYQNVEVYYNGPDITQSYGKNYSEDGYYYGYKWQCVEYVKRFFYLAKGHAMPDVYGNAKDFFSYDTPHGALNESRGLLQYYNGEDVAPQADDLLVFTDFAYGHVAIVTEVSETEIEVIQQNVYGKPRQSYALTIVDGHYTVGTARLAAGWLRVPPA